MSDVHNDDVKNLLDKNKIQHTEAVMYRTVSNDFAADCLLYTSIDFLGYVTFGADHVRLRKRITQKFARKMHEVKPRRRRRELIASFYGMAKHADCRTLFKKLTGKDMRSFKDLDVSYKPEDGKKRFPGVVVSIRELVNLSLIHISSGAGP